MTTRREIDSLRVQTSPEADDRRAADRLRDIEAVTDSGLAHLDVEHLLVELLDRVRDVLDADTAAVLASIRRRIACTLRFSTSKRAAISGVYLGLPGPPLPTVAAILTPRLRTRSRNAVPSTLPNRGG